MSSKAKLKTNRGPATAPEPTDAQRAASAGARTTSPPSDDPSRARAPSTRPTEATVACHACGTVQHATRTTCRVCGASLVARPKPIGDVVELEGDDESAFELARAAVRAQASSSEPSSSEPSSSEPSSSEPSSSEPSSSEPSSSEPSSPFAGWFEAMEELAAELGQNAELPTRKARVDAHAATVRRIASEAPVTTSEVRDALATTAKHLRELSRALDTVASSLAVETSESPAPADGPDEESAS